MPARRNNPITVTRLDGALLTQGEVSSRLRTEVFLRDGLKCRYCGWRSKRVEDFQVDHVRPIAAGGLDELENLCVACEVCSVHKGVNLWVPGRKLRDQPGFSYAGWQRCRRSITDKRKATRRRARQDQARRSADCTDTVLSVLMGEG